MNTLQIIKHPIESELADFIALFNGSLEHEDGLLQQALQHVMQRAGKRMRPILILLLAKNFGKINEVTLHAAVGLELLHTASLVHDDVVDESNERRGQPSVNASYNNKVAVLVGDYILSTALMQVSHTKTAEIVSYLAELGQTLSDGELLQLSNIRREEVTEEAYYKIIARKTAILFEISAAIAAFSVGASKEEVAEARAFGKNLGMIFQIKDDIFDYSDIQVEIGKPTGNDLMEGKLTLPLIYALNRYPDAHISKLVTKVKQQTLDKEGRAELITFAKEHGGIEYAEQVMQRFHAEAQGFIDKYVRDEAIKMSLTAYLDYVSKRTQ